MRHLYLAILAVLCYACTTVEGIDLPYCTHERGNGPTPPDTTYIFTPADYSTDFTHSVLQPSVEHTKINAPENSTWYMDVEHPYLVRDKKELAKLTDAKFTDVDFSKNSLIIFMANGNVPRIRTDINICSDCKNIDFGVEDPDYGVYPKTPKKLLILKTAKYSKSTQIYHIFIDCGLPSPYESPILEE